MTIRDPWEELANAIVVEAVKDWRRAKRKLKRKPGNKDAQILLEECERFFRSGWFGVLTSLDPEMLIQRLRREE